MGLQRAGAGQGGARLAGGPPSNMSGWCEGQSRMKEDRGLPQERGRERWEDRLGLSCESGRIRGGFCRRVKGLGGPFKQPVTGFFIWGGYSLPPSLQPC